MVNSPGSRFNVEALTPHLPPQIRRYLAHSIRPEAPLARRAEIAFHGKVRLKPRAPWISFRARETIEATRSYDIRSQARLGPVPLSIEERYKQGDSYSRVRLLGLVPVMTRSGADAARSARGRVVVESTWLPCSFLPEYGSRWYEEAGNLQLVVPVDSEDVEVALRLGPEGQLRELSCRRWSDLTDDASYAWIPFASYAEAEQTFGDYTVPSQVRAVWWAGTDRQFDFFIASVDDVQYSL